MVHFVSPTGTALDVLKKNARKRQASVGTAYCDSLNQIAREELLSLGSTDCTSGRLIGGLRDEVALEEVTWGDLTSLSWLFDPQKRTLSSPPPRKSAGHLSSRCISHIFDWSRIDPDPSLFGRPDTSPCEMGWEVLHVGAEIQRRGPYDYPVRVFLVGPETMRSISIRGIKSIPGHFKTKEENLRAAMAMEGKLNRALRDARSSGYDIDSRAHFELQACEMDKRKKAIACILGTADGVPGGFGVWLASPVLSDGPKIHIASFGFGYFPLSLSLESLTLQAWNSIVEGCAVQSQKHQLVVKDKAYDVFIPTLPDDVASIREAIFHFTHTGPDFICEEIPWMLTNLSGRHLQRVSDILDGTRRGINAALSKTT